MDNSLKNKTVKGVGWSFADNIVSLGISFLVGLVLARLLTPGEYGLIGLITVFIAVFNSIVDSGFSNALIRKNDANNVDYNTVFIVNMVLSIALFSLLFISAPAISRFFDEPQLVSLSRVMGSIVVINAFAIIQRTILVKRVDFKTQTKISLISSITSGVIGIGMAIQGFGVWSLAGQQISRQLVNTVFLWIFGHWWPKMQFSVQSFKELFGFGWKLLVSGLIDTVWKEIYQLVIGKFYNKEMLGYYTRAQQFGSLFSSNITTVIQRVSYPVLSSIQNDKERLKMAYQKVIKVTMLVTFTCMLGLAAIAKPMILVLIGEKWMPCVPYLQIICFSMMLYPLHAINLNMLQVQGRSDLFLKLEIIKKFIAVVPIALGIFINIYWMLIGSVFTGFIAYYLNAYYSGPFLNYSIKEQVFDILPSLFKSLIMAVMVYLVSLLNLSSFILLPVQLIVGALIMFLLCEVSKPEEYLELKQIAVKIIIKLRYGR